MPLIAHNPPPFANDVFLSPLPKEESEKESFFTPLPTSPYDMI
jgi:hypothetical protein